MCRLKRERAGRVRRPTPVALEGPGSLLRQGVPGLSLSTVDNLGAGLPSFPCKVGEKKRLARFLKGVEALHSSPFLGISRIVGGSRRSPLPSLGRTTLGSRRRPI